MTAERLPAVLAVDGGNSKTDVALVAADGTLLGSARGPGVTGTMRLTDTSPVRLKRLNLPIREANANSNGCGFAPM